MTYDFSGKKILVSGGTRGIGKCIVEQLLKSKADVYVVSQNQENLSSLQKQFPEVKAMCADISNVEATRNAVKPYLPFHALVNNAGIGILEDFLQMNPDNFSRVLAVNLTGGVFLSQIVAQSMVDNDIKGSIVFVSSQASGKPLQAHTSYCCSKAALDSAMKNMALELGPKGIRVNSVNPTVVLTDMGRMAWSDAAKAKPLLDRIFLGHFSEEGPVADAVCWLLSDKSSMTTGACLPVDGGYMAS